ncbi:hypothetical protein PoB_003337000 [Plakobranchus ocellatus]|uniref:Uncharacterized protein n=1 Tax=Plakobranchus ocellatus TaxID=259542 RepID=A0AAV4AFB3_9GAST|nr:hypothetical protein PoB_003337000 [Plakobranchus ocellatus]
MNSIKKSFGAPPYPQRGEVAVLGERTSGASSVARNRKGSNDGSGDGGADANGDDGNGRGDGSGHGSGEGGGVGGGNGGGDGSGDSVGGSGCRSDGGMIIMLILMLSLDYREPAWDLKKPLCLEFEPRHRRLGLTEILKIESRLRTSRLREEKLHAAQACRCKKIPVCEDSKKLKSCNPVRAPPPLFLPDGGPGSLRSSY